MIWSILGVSVAVLAVFCVAVAELLVGRPVFENHREHIALALAVSGVIAWFVGRVLGGKARKESAIESDDESTRIFILFDLRYWGPMLLTLGVITLFIQTLAFRKEKPVATVHPPTPEKIEVGAAPEPKPKAPVVFPAIHVQGIILRQGHPVATPTSWGTESAT